MEKQKITRADLKSIYDWACEKWKKTIADVALFQSGETIEVDAALIQQAFSEADANQKKALKKYFKQFTGDIIDEIETFGDIVRIAKEKHGQTYTALYETNTIGLSNAEVTRINVDRQLDLIALVLNGDWRADFLNRNQSKWTPWFERKSSGWVLGSLGLYPYCRSVAGIGPFFKDEKTSLFAGEKFLDIFVKKLPA